MAGKVMLDVHMMFPRCLKLVQIVFCAYSISCSLLVQMMFCACSHHVCIITAILEDSPDLHWMDGERLVHPERWFGTQQDKDDEDDGAGRCLGIRCRPWVRCQKPWEMCHELFGGKSHKAGEYMGWGALSVPSLAAGAPAFHGGLKVVKHLPAKIAEYLHREHGQIFPSMGLPRKSEPLDRIQVISRVMF